MSGHGHHGGAVVLAAADSRRARVLLAALVLPVLLVTVFGMIRLWPGDTPIGSLPVTGAGVDFVTGTVVEVTDTPGEEVRIALDGDGTVVPVQTPPEILAEGVDVGARMKVLFIPEAMGSGSPYVFVDYLRTGPLALLAALYVVAVLLVARWKGLAAIVGLAVSLGILGVFLLPALLAGRPPLLVTLVGCSAMMFAAVYLAHGISIRTTTALLGTIGGLTITTALAAWGTRSAQLTGTGAEETFQLTALVPGLGLRALLLCGIVIAGLGALNDVTITQASAVWELHASDPTASRRQVFARAMRIGRDHIASTVYTLAFAYVGTALPTLLLVSLYDRTLLEALTAVEIAEEVVRTLVSSVGLVLAIPATTALGAALVRSSRQRGARAEAEASPEAGRAAAGEAVT